MCFRILLSSLFVVSSVSLALAQSRGNEAAGGIGKAYEAAGRSAAAQDLQRKLGGTLVRAVAREKSAARKVSAAGRPKSARPGAPVATPSQVTADDSVAFFTPDPTVDTMSILADQLGSTATERQQLRQLFVATKDAFEREVSAKGRSNNLPAAFTFFIASTVTVYRDDPEPSDKAIDNLWDGMNGAMAEMPELSRLTDAEKQQLYDLLVAFSGFVLAGYMGSKTTQDPGTLNTFKQLSGELIRSILKTDPAKLRFTKDGLNIIN